MINQTVFQLMERTGMSYEEAYDLLCDAADQENDRRRDDEVTEMAGYYKPVETCEYDRYV